MGKRIAFFIIAGLLLVIHAALLGWVAWCQSPTFDEAAHLPAGISHWYFGRFDLYCVNPPLVRLIAAIPVIFADPETPWFAAFAAPGARSEFGVGRDFINANGRRSFFLFALGRWACIPLSVFGAWVCLCWANELYGRSAGLTALALWCFSPCMLAHGSRITPDGGAAAMGVAAGWIFWRWLRRPDWARAFLAGLVLGLAELTKFTLIVFFPLWPLLWLVWRWRNSAAMVDAARAWRREAGQIGLILALGVYTINVGYAFEGTLQRLGDYEFVSRALAGPLEKKESSDQPTGNRFADHWIGAVPVPLPKCYVMGIDAQRGDFERKLWSYLRGQWQQGGWWYFYPYAIAIKVPLGTWMLLMLALVVALFARAYSASWRDEMLLVAPLVVLFALVSSQTGVQYFRYAVPMFPFAFVWMSKVARAVEFKHWKLAFLAALALVWSIASSLAIYPHSLSYFNELVGGPKNGHWHLLDSNIDWGQDLLFLKRWYDEHREARPLGVAFFGLCDPALARIHYLRIPPGASATSSTRTPKAQMGPLPGWYAISVNEIHRLAGDYEYFLRFQPVAMAGYSIYIYHITLDEANRVRRELGLPELNEGDESRGAGVER